MSGYVTIQGVDIREAHSLEYPFFCFPMNLVLALVYPRLSENKTLFSCPCFEEYQKCMGTRRMKERRPQTIIGITKDIERKDILYHPQDMRFFGVRHREHQTCNR